MNISNMGHGGVVVSKGKFQILINEGNRLKNNEDFIEAIDMFKKARLEAIEKEEVLVCLFSIVDCALNRKDYKLGEMYCNEVLWTFGEMEDVYLNLAYIREQERRFLDAYKYLFKAYKVSKKQVYKEGLEAKFSIWEKELWFEYKYNISQVELGNAMRNLQDLLGLICVQGEGDLTADEVYEKYIALIIRTKEYHRIYNLKKTISEFEIPEEEIEKIIDERHFLKKLKDIKEHKELYGMLLDFLIMQDGKNLYHLEKLRLAMEFPSKEYFKILVEKYLNRSIDEKNKYREKEIKIEFEIYDLACSYLMNDCEDLIIRIHEEINIINKVLQEK